MGLHVYGFTRPDTVPPKVEGVAGAPIETERIGSVVALVSEVDMQEITATRANLLAHAHALEALAAERTVLPMQFGVIFDNAEQLIRQVLEPSQSLLVELLDRFDGYVEMLVKAFYVEAAVYADIVARNNEIVRLREMTRNKSEISGYYERIRLGELVQKALQKRKEQDGGILARALQDVSEEIRSEEPAAELMAAHLSCLVARPELDSFLGLTKDLQTRFGDTLRLKVVGPLPPYTFVAGSIPLRPVA